MTTGAIKKNGHGWYQVWINLFSFFSIPGNQQTLGSLPVRSKLVLPGNRKWKLSLGKQQCTAHSNSYVMSAGSLVTSSMSLLLLTDSCQRHPQSLLETCSGIRPLGWLMSVAAIKVRPNPGPGHQPPKGYCVRRCKSCSVISSRSDAPVCAGRSRQGSFWRTEPGEKCKFFPYVTCLVS